MPRMELMFAALALLLSVIGIGMVLVRRYYRRARARALFESPDQAVIRLDRKGRIRRVNAFGERLLDQSQESLEKRPLMELFERGARADALKQLRLSQRGEARSFETTMQVAEGATLAVHITLIPIVVGRWLFGIYVLGRDLRLWKEAEEELRGKALHDYLTGLPNRALLHDRLLKALQRSRRTGNRSALLYFDLDRFKTINDTAGHEVGDLLLKGVAQRLECFIRDGDTVARLGGDEFAVLLEDIEDSEAAEAAAERVATLLGKPIRLQSHNILTGASVGIAISSPKTESPDELIRQADLAMYEAKRRGGHQFELYTPQIDVGRDALPLHLESELRAALARDELEVYYQPIVDLAGNVIVGVEALVRWNHPEHGLLRPSAFIHLAEQSGLIVPLDRWVLDRACTEIQVLAGFGVIDPSRFTLSVNFSKRQLEDGNPYGVIESTLRSSGLSAETLLVEITESVAGHDQRSVEQLKALGVKLAIDDFGTGYSSLAYLSELSFDVLKIDQSFVAKLEREQAADAIVRTIITMADAMRLGVITEGVEKAAQVSRLREIGGRLVQGYYFAEPMDFNSLRELLERGLPPVWAHRPHSVIATG